ncbi:MAG: TonB-dependent receptor [Acidobacteria bacterium]|nr:TonB-dependent receptor [Acidobacteriota bacterium]
MNRYIVLATRKLFCLGLLVLFVCAFSGRASAQSATGTIYGTVVDATGAVVPGAKVTATNVRKGTSQTVTTSNSGEYTFPVLEPGDYTVASQITGFQTQTQQGVRLDASQNVHVNFTLQVGQTEENVVVTADTTLVDTRESQIGATVDQKRIEDLPLNGRNAYDLLSILPGVTNYAPDVQTGSRQGAQIVVNGIPGQNTAYYLDGTYDTQVWRFGGNLLPNPDALEEFRVLTSNFDAEFGRSAGGVVNAITRSGTNQYHGLVYEYLRNDVFNAKPYFQSGVPALKQNQFGANFGGPLPMLRDKAFFFLSYQGLRIHQPANVTSTQLSVPTALERMGDFRLTPEFVNNVPTRPDITSSASCGSIKYYICPSDLDPVAQALLQFVPVGDSDPNNYRHTVQQSANGNINSDQGMVRLDYHLGQKHQISGLYFESKGVSNAPTVGGNQIVSYAGMTNYEGQYNAIASDIWTISPNKVNDVRAFYSLNHYIIGNIYGNQHMLADLGSNAAQGGNYNAQPYFNVQGFWQMGTSNAGPNNLPSASLGISDVLHWSHGKHELKLGGAYIWNHFASTGGGSSNGLFTFTGSTVGATKASAPLVDFLQGNANSLVQNNGVAFRNHNADPSLFIQDNWRIHPRLSLNLGLRWEYFPMYTGQNNTGTFVLGQQSTRFPTAPLGLVFAGDKGIPDGILHTPWNTFAPRVGFAYDVFGNGKTSLRGAYGLFYSAMNQVSVSNNLVQQPFSRSKTANKTPDLVNPWAPDDDPFPYTPSTTNAVFLAGANLFGLSENDHYIPSVHQFSLGVQQQYSPKWSSQVSYVGNLGRRFYITTDINSPIYSYNAATSTAGLNARRPIQKLLSPNVYQYASISIAAPRSNTAYHSLQATLQRRFDHHFSLQASYVWSKVIGYNPVVNQYDVASSRGLLPIDLRHAFVVSYIYVTPEVHRFSFIGKQILSGWQLNGITKFQSGQPFNITSGVDANRDGTNNDRPNQVGNPELPGGRSRAERAATYFSRAAFAPVNVNSPSVSPYGNVQFDSMIGPKYVNTDLSAFKDFAIYEQMKLQFRGEVFNVFNNVNMNNPNGNLNAGANFGRISDSGPARIVQLALRLSF